MPDSNVMVGFGEKKDSFFSNSPSSVIFLKKILGKMAKTGLSFIFRFRGFSPSTSSYRPSFLRHVPALAEEEFKDPEFCKRVAGLERTLRVRARIHKPPGVCNCSVGGGERDLAADSEV